jgi:formylglycine-generating enzyme required for sulfatase activity
MTQFAARQYTKWLSRITGQDYRLPSEAEWEYAARAGTTTAYSFGDDAGKLDRYAWTDANADYQTHAVGTREPNPWGLFDMHGNVAEWCNDVYQADYYQSAPAANPRGPAEGEKYVLRGGAWNCSAEACRASYRVGENPGFQDACFAQDAVGFRCVRKAPSPDVSQEHGADEEAEPEAKE